MSKFKDVDDVTIYDHNTGKHKAKMVFTPEAKCSKNGIMIIIGKHKVLKVFTL